MMVFPTGTQTSETVYAMAKPVPTTCGEQQAANELDQRLKDLLNALRKPVKPTATLQRRALKNKATSAIRASSPSPRPENGTTNGETEGIRSGRGPTIC